MQAKFVELCALWSSFNTTVYAHFTYSLKLWPLEVYQACSAQLKSGRTGCGCEVHVCVNVSGSECGNIENVIF